MSLLPSRQTPPNSFHATSMFFVQKSDRVSGRQVQMVSRTSIGTWVNTWFQLPAYAVPERPWGGPSWASSYHLGLDTGWLSSSQLGPVPAQAAAGIWEVNQQLWALCLKKKIFFNRTDIRKENYVNITGKILNISKTNSLACIEYSTS